MQASHHLQLQPGTNVAVINAISHVIATEGLVDRAFVEERCDPQAFAAWEEFIRLPENSPEALAEQTGVPADLLRSAARAFAGAPNARHLLRPRCHRAQPGLDDGDGHREPRDGHRATSAAAGVGVNPLRGQNNVQGSCDMGSFPHELAGYRHVSDDTVRHQFESVWGATLQAVPGLRIPNMLDAATVGTFRAMYVQGEDIAQSDPNTQHVKAALSAMDLVIVQDLFLNETAKFAHVFLPGTSFLEKDGTFTNAERRINRVRPVMPARTGMAEWEVTCALATAMGYPMQYDSAAEIMDEIAALTPTFAGVSFALLDRVGSVQWPCNADSPFGTPIMHEDHFVRGLGRFVTTPYVPTDERTTRTYPLLLTTGRILSQYNVGAQTRRTANVVWHAEDVLDMHESDAELRGIARRHVGRGEQPGRHDVDAGAHQRRRPGRSRVHHFPSPRQRRERRDHRQLGLGHELPGVQGHGGRGPARLTRGRGRMTVDPLVRMANQIAASVPGRHDVAAETAAHLARFWTPGMIDLLVGHVRAHPDVVGPDVRQALTILRPEGARRG